MNFEKTLFSVFAGAMCLALTACGGSDSNSDAIPIIQFGDAIDTADAANLFDFSVMTLTAPGNEVLLGSIDDVYSSGDRVFISGSDKVLCFNRDGEYVASIGAVGQGSGEYVSLGSFFVNESQGVIGIFDWDSDRLLYYSLDDFSYQRSIQLNTMVSNCCISGGDYLVWNTFDYMHKEPDGSAMTFTITNCDGVVENRFVPSEFVSGYYSGTPHPFYQIDGRNYGYKVYGDMTVYEINAENAVAKWEARVKDHSLAPIDWLKKESNDGNDMYFRALSDSPYISSYSIEETSRAIMLNYMLSRQSFVSFYDKSARKSVTFSRDKFAADLGIGPMRYFLAEPLFDKFVAMIDPAEVEDLDINPQLRSKLDKIGYDGNPVLILFDFK